jgi:hypothetical protein
MDYGACRVLIRQPFPRAGPVTPIACESHLPPVRAAVLAFGAVIHLSTVALLVAEARRAPDRA